MSEEGFRTFQMIISALTAIAYAVSFTAFFAPFLRETKHAVKTRSAVVLGIFILPYIISVNINVNIPSFINLLAVIVILAVVSPFLRIQRQTAMFLSVVFFSIRALCALAVESLFFIYTQYFVQTEQDISLIFLRSAWGFAFIMLIQFILFALMLFIVSRVITKSRLQLSMKEACFLMLIPISGILYSNIIFRSLLGIKEGVIFQLYEQHPTFIWLAPLSTFLFYLGTLIIIAAYRELTMLQQEKSRFFVQRQQIRAMHERLAEVDRFYAGIRQMKHEMRGHLTNIKGLVQSRHYDELEKYISNLNNCADVFDINIQTGNPVSDVIINDKCRQAEKSGVKFESDFRYPDSGGYDAYDIGIIVNNILENALEACENIVDENKYIILSGRQRKKFFIIEVKNPFKGEVNFDDQTGLPLTTKESNSFLHGIGLSNVKKETEKYMGEMEIRAEDSEFCVTVMLQERESPAGCGRV